MHSGDHVDPTRSQLESLAAAAGDRDGAVVMVNLLEFREETGAASYARYAREVQPHLERVGAQVLYAGDAAEMVIGGGNEPWWDAIVVVRYPSRAAFLDMIRDPAYQQISVHRSQALVGSELIATDPWGPTA